jgi:hypothetical protein
MVLKVQILYLALLLLLVEATVLGAVILRRLALVVQAAGMAAAQGLVILAVQQHLVKVTMVALEAVH